MDNSKLDKLIEKKKREGKLLSPMAKKAKGQVAEHLMDEMDAMGGEMLQGAKKVVVKSDSKEGLEKGLEKAKEIVEQKLPEESEEESEDMDESQEEEASEDMSKEELESQIRKLQELLKQKSE